MDIYTIEFRIEGLSLVPSEITKLLNLEPSITSDMLSTIKNSSSRTPFWGFDGISTENNFIEQRWKSLEDGLIFVLEKILPKYTLNKNELNNYKLYWWCGHFQKSLSNELKLSPDLINKLSMINAELIIKTYQMEDEA